jgi:hypothetical protein
MHALIHLDWPLRLAWGLLAWPVLVYLAILLSSAADPRAVNRRGLSPSSVLARFSRQRSQSYSPRSGSRFPFTARPGTYFSGLVASSRSFATVALS